MDPIDEALAVTDREWRACGISRADRAALAADLRIDLESAAADGVSPTRLLGTDLRAFARRVADEAGVRRVPREYGRVVLTALTGAVTGAGAGALLLFVAYPLLVSSVDGPAGFRAPVLVSVLLYYGAAAALVAGGAVLAVRTQLTDLPRIRQTTHAMLVLLPLAGAVITPVTMLFARAAGYSSAFPIVSIEVGLVTAAVAGAVVLARAWALRDPARPDAAVPA